jgi:hypothetical protein
MSKDPAFLFYSSDFISGTLTMTDDEVGKYIRALCLQHQKGRLSEKDMIYICKSYDSIVFEKFIKDEDGYYINQKLKEVANKRKLYSESRSKNRKSNKNKDNICTSYDNHMENENICINTNTNTNTGINNNTSINTNKEIDEISKILIDLTNEVISYFGFENDKDKYLLTYPFIKEIKRCQNLQKFQTQFRYFKLYYNIDDNKRYRGSLEKFINGKWNSENWKDKLNTNGSNLKLA